MVSLLLWFLLDFSHSCWFSQLVPGLGWKFLEGLSHTPEASVLIVGWDALVLLPVAPLSQQKSKNFPIYITWQLNSNREQFERTGPSGQVLIKPVLALLLLMSHRSKQVTWSSPESMGEGIT